MWGDAIWCHLMSCDDLNFNMMRVDDNSVDKEKEKDAEG